MQRVDFLTVAGWGFVLMPLLTMWHEIGGHAAACVVQGGHVATLGAFYVDCVGLSGLPDVIVACAGVTVNLLLAIVAHGLWRRATGDASRIVLWLVWVSEAFVASGYFLFSGATGFGDLGIGKGGSLSGLDLAWPVQVGEILFGVASYVLLVRAAIQALDAMIGKGPETRRARRLIAHVYYASVGMAAVLVGLLNPLGIVITVLSAAASSFGGLAGFISIGFAAGTEGVARPVLFPRNLLVVGLGLVMAVGFGAVLGPSVQFPVE